MSTSFLKWLWASSLVCSVFAIDGKANENSSDFSAPQRLMQQNFSWIGNSSDFSAPQRLMQQNFSWIGNSSDLPPVQQNPMQQSFSSPWDSSGFSALPPPMPQSFYPMQQSVSSPWNSGLPVQQNFFFSPSRDFSALHPHIQQNFFFPSCVENSRGLSAPQSTLTLSPDSPFTPYQAPTKREHSPEMQPEPLPPCQEPTKREQTVTPEPLALKERRIETTPLLETQPKYDVQFKLQRLLGSSWSLDDIYKSFKAIVWKHSNNKEGKENLWKKLPKKIQPQSYKEAKTIKSKERVISHWFGKQKGNGVKHQNRILDLLKKSRKFTRKEINALKNQFKKKAPERKRP